MALLPPAPVPATAPPTATATASTTVTPAGFGRCTGCHVHRGG